MARPQFEKQDDYIMRGINSAQIGKVLSIDVLTESLSVQLYNKDFMWDNDIPKSSDAIILDGVPFYVYSGGVASMQMPISTGDDCLIVFCDYNYNGWNSTKNVTTDINAPHTKNYPIALVGVKSTSLVNGDYSVNDVVIKNGEISKLVISPNNIDSTAENINITSTLGPVNIVSASTVNISNSTAGKSLSMVLDTLFIAIRDGVDTGGHSFDNNTKSAINAAMISIKEVIG